MKFTYPKLQIMIKEGKMEFEIVIAMYFYRSINGNFCKRLQKFYCSLYYHINSTQNDC